MPPDHRKELILRQRPRTSPFLVRVADPNECLHLLRSEMDSEL